MNLRVLRTAAKTLVMYAVAGYYLHQAVAAVKSIEHPAEGEPPKHRLRRPCPCTARKDAPPPEAPDGE